MEVAARLRLAHQRYPLCYLPGRELHLAAQCVPLCACPCAAADAPAVGQVIIPSLRADWYLENPQCTKAMQSASCGITAICQVFPSTIPSCMATCPALAYQCQSDSFDYAWV